MSKGSGRTRKSGSRGISAPAMPEVSAKKQELYQFAERISSTLTIDPGDAVFERISSIGKDSIISSIERSTDYDVMNYKKYEDGSIDIQVLNRSESAEDYDYGDDGFRSVAIDKNATVAGVILDLRRRQFQSPRSIMVIRD